MVKKGISHKASLKPANLIRKCINTAPGSAFTNILARTESTYRGSGQLNPVTLVKRPRFSGDSEKSSNSAPRVLPLASRF